MNLRRVIYVFSLFAILSLARQEFLAEDLNVTVTHPSVFHDELRDYRVTITANENNPMIRPKAKRPLNISELIANFTNGEPLNLADIEISGNDSSSEDYSEETSNDTSLYSSDDADSVLINGRRYYSYNAEMLSNLSSFNVTRYNASNETSDDTGLCSDLEDADNVVINDRRYFNYNAEMLSNLSNFNVTGYAKNDSYVEGTSDDSSLCSSDFTSDFTSDDTSDGTSDSDENILSALIGAAKDLQEKVAGEANRQVRLTKLQAKKNWDALKYKIIREAQAAEIPTEEIKQHIKDAKREVKNVWRDFKSKVMNGTDILDELLDNTDPLNPNIQNRGNTEPANETYRPIF